MVIKYSIEILRYEISEFWSICQYIDNDKADAYITDSLTAMPTFSRSVNSALCSGPLPRDPGNSQSTSRPSKPWRRTKLAAFVANTFRVLVLATTATKGPDPARQPPTARRTLRRGFDFFNPTVLAYKPSTKPDFHVSTITKTLLTIINIPVKTKAGRLLIIYRRNLT